MTHLLAMANGIPSVVFNTNVAEYEAGVDGENGLMVNIGDVNGLANAIIRLLSDNSIRQKMAALSQQRVRESFSDSAVYKTHAKLYALVMQPE